MELSQWFMDPAGYSRRVFTNSLSAIQQQFLFREYRLSSRAQTFQRNIHQYTTQGELRSQDLNTHVGSSGPDKPQFSASL